MPFATVTFAANPPTLLAKLSARRLAALAAAIEAELDGATPCADKLSSLNMQAADCHRRMSFQLRRID